jgi:hypothetical protein
MRFKVQKMMENSFAIMDTQTGQMAEGGFGRESFAKQIAQKYESGKIKVQIDRGRLI